MPLDAAMVVQGFCEALEFRKIARSFVLCKAFDEAVAMGCASSTPAADKPIAGNAAAPQAAR
jgi:hypothetical protein